MKVGDIASYDLGALDPDKLRETMGSLQCVVARQDLPALEVAARFKDHEGGLVVVVDAAGEPRGIIDPIGIRRRLELHKQIHSRSLLDALEQYAADPMEALREFRHEWLAAGYDPYWCNVGKHFTTPAPCQVHER